MLSTKYKLLQSEFKHTETISCIIFNIVENKSLNEIAYVEAIIDSEDKNVTIIDINVCVDFRGKGIATYLLISVLKYSDKRNIKIILLDDMTDKAWSPNNIYIKLGLIYINPEPEPEMKGLISEILKKNDV